MKQVIYTLKDDIVVLRNSGVTLRFGAMKFDETRWVVTKNVFQQLQEENPDVKFVKFVKGE